MTRNRIGVGLSKDSLGICDPCRAELANLVGRIDRIDTATAHHVAGQPALAEDAALLRSISGIGPVVAIEVLAHPFGAGRIDLRTITSLAGLAPRAQESGRFRGGATPATCGVTCREALHMAALSALRHQVGLRRRKRRRKGKPTKVILIAVARRLIVVANATLRSIIPFQPPGRTVGWTAPIIRSRHACRFATSPRAGRCPSHGRRPFGHRLVISPVRRRSGSAAPLAASRLSKTGEPSPRNHRALTLAAAAASGREMQGVPVRIARPSGPRSPASAGWPASSPPV